MIDDNVLAQNTIQRHRETVSAVLNILADQIKYRGIYHDRSKLQQDEFESQVRINKAGRKFKYGSSELQRAIEKEEIGLNLHYSRNSHHPEYHDNVQDMGFLDIIEMVIDWHSASLTYGNTPLSESYPSMRKRYDFSDQQWWLIEQIVDWLSEN